MLSPELRKRISRRPFDGMTSRSENFSTCVTVSGSDTGSASAGVVEMQPMEESGTTRLDRTADLLLGMGSQFGEVGRGESPDENEAGIV